MIVLLIGSNKLDIRKNYHYYIFLVIVPILYPYFFKILNYFYKYLTNANPIHGPKNAFVDTNGETSLLDAYNT